MDNGIRKKLGRKIVTRSCFLDKKEVLKERQRAYQLLWARSNPDKVKERRERHKEKQKILYLKWVEKNWEKRKAYHRDYYARKLKVKTKVDWLKLCGYSSARTDSSDRLSTSTLNAPGPQGMSGQNLTSS